MLSTLRKKQLANRVVTASAILFVVAACETSSEIAHKQPGKLFFKPDMEAKSYIANTQACREASKDVKGHVPSSGSGSGYYSGGGGLIGALAAGLIVGAIKGAQQAAANDDARSRAFAICMERRGYVVADAPDSVIDGLRRAGSDQERVADIIEGYRQSPEFSVSSDWYVAANHDTLEAYNAFLNSHPDSAFDEILHDRRKELLWASATEVNTVSAYTYFADQYPDAEQAEKVPARIDGITLLQSKTGGREGVYYLELKETDMAGLEANGWRVSTYTSSSQITPCYEPYLKMSVRMKFTGEIGFGYLRAQNVDPKEVFGRLGSNGVLQVYATWPEDDPIVMKGRLQLDGIENANTNFVVRTTSAAKKRCRSIAEFEFPEVDPTAGTTIEAWMGGPEKPRLEIHNALEDAEQRIALGS